MAKLFSGTEGTVSIGNQELLQVSFSTGSVEGSMQVGDEDPVVLPPNSDFEWKTAGRFYGVDLTFTNTVFFFAEAGDK